LRWVVGSDTGHGFFLYKLWFNPETGDEVNSCPWLKELPSRKYACLIHDVKPRHCRDWPLTKEDANSSCCTAVVS
jgi:hypothetical protein